MFFLHTWMCTFVYVLIKRRVQRIWQLIEHKRVTVLLLQSISAIKIWPHLPRIHQFLVSVWCTANRADLFDYRKLGNFPWSPSCIWPAWWSTRTCTGRGSCRPTTDRQTWPPQAVGQLTTSCRPGQLFLQLRKNSSHFWKWKRLKVLVKIDY